MENSEAPSAGQGAQDVTKTRNTAPARDAERSQSTLDDTGVSRTHTLAKAGAPIGVFDSRLSLSIRTGGKTDCRGVQYRFTGGAQGPPGNLSGYFSFRGGCTGSEACCTRYQKRAYWYCCYESCC